MEEKTNEQFQEASYFQIAKYVRETSLPGLIHTWYSVRGGWGSWEDKVPARLEDAVLELQERLNTIAAGHTHTLREALMKTDIENSTL